MSSFMEMELSARWGSENLLMFGSKVPGNPKKLELEDWVFRDNDDINAGAFNLSGVKCGSGGSGSEMGNSSSGKSSMSASANSSPKNGMESSGFAFEDLRGSFGDFTDELGAEISEMSGASPLLEASIGSIELMTDLKLGKRECLENRRSGGPEKSPSSVISTPSTTATKKIKSLSLGCASTPRCQVEGCNRDLSSAKDYHRKHRVCDNHSKSSRVIVKGLERRFCQQCSRFHGLSEFDEKKRSCRRRLSDHNARRRKPQQETIAYHPSRLPSSFYDGRKRMTYLLNTGAHTRNSASSDRESTYEPKFAITKGYASESYNCGLLPGQPQMAGNQMSYAISVHGNPSSGFSAPKSNAASRFLSPQGFKDVTSATVGTAPDFYRALSLLSTNSWGSCEPMSIPFDNNTIHASRMNTPQPLMHAIPQGSLPSSEYWMYGQPSTYPRMHSLAPGSSGMGHNEGSQFAKMPYGTDFYLSPLQD